MRRRRYLSDVGKVEFAGEREEQVTTQNRNGQWVPAIPLPLYGLRKRCTCGRKFWTDAGYQGHYALRHILSL